MPKYSIIATSTDAGRVLTIQDERTLDELASDLTEDGYIISTDVTPIAGVLALRRQGSRCCEPTSSPSKQRGPREPANGFQPF